MTKSRIRVGILALSLPQMAATGLIGVVPMAIAHYSHVSPTIVQTAFTLPMLVSAIMTLAVGWLSSKTGKKIPLVVGTGMMIVCGALPAVVDLPLPLFMAAMAGFGVGLGCLPPLSTGLIPEHFSGQEQPVLMGQQSAFVNMGGMALTFIAGLLIATGWKNTFFMYLTIIPILILAITCLPADKPTASSGERAKVKIKLGSKVLALYAVFFVFGLMFAIINTNAGLLVIERNLGDPAMASFSATVTTAVGIIVGFTYGSFVKVLKSFALPFSMAAFTCAMLTMAAAPSLLFFFIGSFMVGASAPIAIPTGFSILTKLVPPPSHTFAIAGMMAAWSVGIFFSPMVVNPISQAVAGGTAQSRYMIGAAVIGTLCLMTFAAQKKKFWV